MGNLLRVLHCKDEPYDEIFLDFEDARPSDSEKEVYTRVSHVLSFAPGIIKELEAYKGAESPIRKAIQNSSCDEKQKDAWDAILPLVRQLKDFFEFSLNLEKCVQELLKTLTSHDQTTTQHLEAKQALAKQFAEILQYTLKFDDLKMNNPNIQNDFSYFKRIMSCRGMNNASSIIDYKAGSSIISTELANKMSLFYAEATPMLKTLSDTTTKFVKENDEVEFERTSEVLSTMGNICKVMLENPVHMQRFQMGEDTVHFCLRVMVGVIILYDHVHPSGAFCKGSKIDIKGAIKVLKDQHQGPMIENLLNALRYTTKHLNDETTPKAIRALMQPGF